MRATFNKDIKTGNFEVNDGYSTVGPTSVFHIKNEVPEWPESSCYILSPGTCTEEQYEQVLNGTVLIKDFVVVEYDVRQDVKGISEMDLAVPGDGDMQGVLMQSEL